MYLSQKDAVYKAADKCRKPDGTIDRKEVIEEISAMYRRDEWVHKEPDKMRDDKALRAYGGNMLSNWLRRDPRLGGTPPAPQAPGATGERRKKERPADDEMKRLMEAKVKLISLNQPTEEIDAHIQRRTSELQAQRDAVRRESEADAEALLSAAGSTNPV